ncbi:hypothetical protein ACU8MW_08115 [Rhizobium leguminosarum]
MCHLGHFGRLGTLRAGILAFLVSGIWPSAPTYASVLGLLGVDSTVDHAFDRMQGAIDKAKGAALAIEAQTNEDATARLAQIQSIADETVRKVSDLEKQSFKDAADFSDHLDALVDGELKKVDLLETQFMNELSHKIREVECTADRVLNAQLKDALGGLGAILGTHEIALTPAILYPDEHRRCGLYYAKCRLTATFPVREPFTETYKEIKAYLEDRMSNLREDTPASSVVDTYALIADLAKRTTCFTQANDLKYEAEFAHYNSLVRQWNEVLTDGR